MAVGIISIFGLLIVGVLVLMVASAVWFVVKALTHNRGVAVVLAGGVAALMILSVGAQIVVRPASFVTATTTDSTHTSLSTGQTHMEFGNDSSWIEDIKLVPTLAEPDVSAASGLTVAGTPWSNAVEEFQDFEADVYPSIEAAAEALGRRVGKRLMEASDTSEGNKQSIYVWRERYEGMVYGHTVSDRDMIISRKALDVAASGIRQKLENPAYVSVEKSPSGNRADYAVVNAVFQEINFDNHNRWGQHAETKTGGLALRVETPDGPFSVSTRFADSPWVENRNAFATSYSKGNWLVGYSDGTHTTHEEAKQDAIWAATDVLLPLAKARISQLSASDQHHFAQQMQKDANWLRNRVADELVSRNMLTDRFAQRFDRPYGTVWREAVLIDASPKRVEAIARSLVQGVDAKVTHKRNTFLSFLALGGLVFGTYLFLNMATKGYYAWALRFAAVGGIAAAVFLVRFL